MGLQTLDNAMPLIRAGGGLRIVNDAMPRPSAMGYNATFGPPEWWVPLGGPSTTLNDDKSLTITTNYASRRNIAEDTAKIPFKLLKYGVNAAGLETRTAMVDPLATIFSTRFNPNMTAFVGRSVMEDWAVGIGNGWAEIVRDPLGRPVELYPIHPSRVPITQARKLDDQTYVFKVYNNNGTYSEIAEGDVFHIFGYSQDGRFGIPIVQALCNTLGLMSALEVYLKKFFENSARPSVVLQSKELLTPESRKELREQWQQAYGGAHNAGSTAVVDLGVEVKPFETSFKAMEMTDLATLKKKDIAMAYRMPMSKLQDAQNAQGWGTLDAMEADYINSALMPWLVRWEQEIHRQLMGSYEGQDALFEGYPDDVQAHFETKGLLRGDIASRMAYFTARFNLASITPNEIRELEDENPSDDPAANRLFIQGAMVPLDMAGEAIKAQVEAAKNPPMPQEKPSKAQLESFATASRLPVLNGNHQ